MALFTSREGRDYARGHMPKPKTADGPWGEAIRHWMDVKKISQADIARETKIQPKTVSRIVRGFHTQTRLLERIAAVFDVPLDAVLVSPARRLANEERRRMIIEITDEAMRKYEARAGVANSPSPQTLLIAERLATLQTHDQEYLLTQIEELRQQPSPHNERQHTKKTGKKQGV